MENEHDNLKSEPRPAGVGLGERLQAARIQQGLSVDDVASRMHLNVGIVRSIEENNFDEITAPIFVKGYLRAYARIVSLDEEELIEQYANYYSHEDPPITTTSHMAPELSVADVRIKWTTYLVIAGLAALLAAWWWNKNQSETTPISLGSEGNDEQVVRMDADLGGDALDDGAADSIEPGLTTAPPDLPDATAPQPPVAEAPAAQPEVAEAVEPAADAAVTEEPAASQPAADEPPAPATTAAEPEAPASAADESAADQAPATAAADESAATGTNAAADESAAAEPAPVRLGPPVLVAPSGDDKLSITVNADTWADIKDGNDFQMVYHLLRADQSLELTGSAPFSVFLGNGRGVEIRFNGEEVEFSQRIRSNNTTRLSIGG